MTAISAALSEVAYKLGNKKGENTTSLETHLWRTIEGQDFFSDSKGETCASFEFVIALEPKRFPWVLYSTVDNCRMEAASWGRCGLSFCSVGSSLCLPSRTANSTPHRAHCAHAIFSHVWLKTELQGQD